MQLAELHRTSYLRPSGSVVVQFERYNQHRISGTERLPSSSSLKRSCQVAQLYVALLQFIMAAFETTRVRPPATLVDYLCMLHVLTDVRSSRALRLCLWSASQFRQQDRSRQAAVGRSSRAHSSTRCSARRRGQRRGSGSGLERGLPLAAAVLDGGDGGLLPACAMPRGPVLAPSAVCWTHLAPGTRDAPLGTLRGHNRRA